MTKLHLGCGKRHIPGFYHADVVDYPHVDLRHEVDRLPMMANESVDLIYACHVLEHFHRRDIVRVLQEWHRILKVGGVLRLSVPSWEALVELYRRTSDLGLVIGPLFGRGDYLYNVHWTVFDFKTLDCALSAAGFADAHLYDWRQTEHADVDDYSQAYFPHMDKDNGLLLSLNVEAMK